MWKWDGRKIPYIGVMIATSVVFVLIGSMMFAVTTFPSVKIGFAGVPVKLTGFLFGPMIGFVTGFIVDILSFLYLPTYYHIGYSLSMAITGMVPGIVMYFMTRKKYAVNTYFIVTLAVLLIICVSLFVGVWFMPNEILQNKRVFIHNKIIYEIIVLVGFVVLFFITIILRFTMKQENFKGMSQIIIFVAILGVINPLLVPLWDQSSIGLKYSVGLAARIILTPPEMIMNIIIVYTAWKVVNPLVKTKLSNNY